ncbi:hypothetical protein HPP92_007318 [Vanilla planifolia]|uniref:DUF1308 domain-containing protein n=1 Tax=Vanilla planifolia TaxID=51239 RepID=A0A835RM58_VANPL|nr:hypothetical protein HPP92_007318 [Vanilla planifolia]
MDTAGIQRLEAAWAKQRCLSLQDRIQSLPSSKLSAPAKVTLLRLLHAELRFLSRILSPSTPVTSNVGYFESIVTVLLHPALCHASRLCKPLPSSATHVDIVCTFDRFPSWFLVSDSNPSRISWSGGLRARVERVLHVARSTMVALKPSSLFLVFSRGLPDGVASAIGFQFGAVEVSPHANGVFFEGLELEEGWVSVGSWEMKGSRWFEIKIPGDNLDCSEKIPIIANALNREEVECGNDPFGELISLLKQGGMESVDVINFDTTALIAMVSGISNGGAGRLLRAPEIEMIQRFKGNYKFVIAQVNSELEKPILSEIKTAVEGKNGIICDTVYLEFKELICMCGGTFEKSRADQLLKNITVVPDKPSARVASLPSTRKISTKNKVVFGTGDYWNAPTLTANLGFVRAIYQAGMSLLTIEHRPRALTGD